MSWRLRRALEYGRVSVAEMARELGVNRATVSRWMHGSSRPRAAYLKVWALRCGVRYEWLFDGSVSEDASALVGSGVILPRGRRVISRGSAVALGGMPGRAAIGRPPGRPRPRPRLGAGSSPGDYRTFTGMS